MMELSRKKCVPCEKGGKALSGEYIQSFMKELKAWALSSDQKNISKNFMFIDFRSAMSFANEVADIAEFEGHHPNIFIHTWNQVTITLYTHAVKGLTENDFIIAAKIDQIIKDAE